jgi:actin related protein 2/3 complex, subunit 3
VKGPADRVLLYITYYIKQCLLKIEKLNKSDAEKALYQLAIENFQIPGDGGFVFGGYFQNPNGRQEADTIRAYFTQLRQETGVRLVDRVYPPGQEASASKWWICFNKRKFLNLA